MICIGYLYGSNYQELADISLPILTEYCKRHNYELWISKLSPNPNGRYDFLRIEFMQDLLNKFDVVLMLEGDFLLTNMNYKIEDVLKEGKDFYFCKDINGINTGSFICRSTDWVKELLNEILTYKNKIWDEQIFFETFTDDRIEYLAHPSINSVPYEYYVPSYGYINPEKQSNPIIPTHEEGNWQQGDWFLHLPGMELSQRLKLFQEYKNTIVW